MFSFSFINLIEALLVWLCSWISSIIISNGMSQYYLGIYKNATSMVNALFGIVTSAIIPVLFSSLSRLKDNEKEFINMYCSMQSVVAFILLPMGAGLFLYRNLATKILFGSQWSAANIVIGLTCVVSVLKIIFSYFASEAYRAKGRPIISIFTQIIFLLVSIPACVLTVNIGSVAHPMSVEHLIEWIYVEYSNGGEFVYLKDEPIARFNIANKEVKAVYSYCNLHGLWYKEI